MPFKNKHPLYEVWRGMIQRCNYPNTPAWPSYGGRGISVCARWSERGIGFHNFIADMGPRPDGYTIERIDNDGNYEPSNCKWATRAEQQSNRRCTIWLDIEGEKYLLAELARLTGMKPDSIKARALQGLTYEQVIHPEKRVFTDGLALGGKANGARQKSKTHCPKGHEYAPENLLASKDGFRRCKKCHAERAYAKRYAAQ